MSTFELYFGLGREHIMDVTAYDHILFVIALCVVYRLSEWRRVLILVTAFTIGHSLTLALASLDVIRFNAAVIEALIPVTILITAIGNFINLKKERKETSVSINYFYALFFGLIHGMGFSNYLRSLLGSEQSIVMPLFGFNLGLELGQFLIVLLFFAFEYIIFRIVSINRSKWIMGVSTLIGAVSIYLFVNAVI